MAIRDILVHVNTSRHGSVRLDLACALARRHSAHLVGLYVIDVPGPPLLYGNAPGFVDVAAIEEATAAYFKRARDEAATVEQGFRKRLERESLQSEWRLVEGVPADMIALHARYSDFAIVGQGGAGDGIGYGADVPVTTMLSSGRPVLVVPDVGRFAGTGQNILVGWKSSREAARALHDALPLLQAARSVKILAINPAGGIAEGGEHPATDVVRHLSRHGVRAEATHTIAGDLSEGEVLLNEAADMSADLIVVGGYGHSRMRELVFGGVTRTLLSTMTMPVLFSH